MNKIKLRIVGGEKLLIYLPLKIRNQLNFPFGALVQITIKKEDKNYKLLTKYNYNITLKKEIIKELNLKKGDILEITIRKQIQTKKPSTFFKNGNVDLLFFLPEKTKKGSNIYFETEKVNGADFLRIASIYQRGSSSQVFIRRYITPRLLGNFLGQIQSEGTKTDHDKLEFCNKNFDELKEFISFLIHIGIPRNKICTKLDYHEKYSNSLNQISKDFSRAIRFKLNYVSCSNKSRGGYGFKIILRSTILSELFLNTLVKIRNSLGSNTFEGDFKKLCEGYLAKILDGDGSFEITSKKRKRFQSRLLIADGNVDYLDHYKILLEKFGFKPKINEKYKYIRALCNLAQAKELLKISAFNNNANKQRILLFIRNNEVTTK